MDSPTGAARRSPAQLCAAAEAAAPVPLTSDSGCSGDEAASQPHAARSPPRHPPVALTFEQQQRVRRLFEARRSPAATREDVVDILRGLNVCPDHAELDAAFGTHAAAGEDGRKSDDDADEPLSGAAAAAADEPRCVDLDTLLQVVRRHKELFAARRGSDRDTRLLQEVGCVATSLQDERRSVEDVLRSFSLLGDSPFSVFHHRFFFMDPHTVRVKDAHRLFVTLGAVPVPASPPSPQESGQQPPPFYLPMNTNVRLRVQSLGLPQHRGVGSASDDDSTAAAKLAATRKDNDALYSWLVQAAAEEGDGADEADRRRSGGGGDGEPAGLPFPHFIAALRALRTADGGEALLAALLRRTLYADFDTEAGRLFRALGGAPDRLGAPVLLLPASPRPPPVDAAAAASADAAESQEAAAERARCETLAAGGAPARFLEKARAACGALPGERGCIGLQGFVSVLFDYTVLRGEEDAAAAEAEAAARGGGGSGGGGGGGAGCSIPEGMLRFSAGAFSVSEAATASDDAFPRLARSAAEEEETAVVPSAVPGPHTHASATGPPAHSMSAWQDSAFAEYFNPPLTTEAATLFHELGEGEEGATQQQRRQPPPALLHAWTLAATPALWGRLVPSFQRRVRETPGAIEDDRLSFPAFLAAAKAALRAAQGCDGGGGGGGTAVTPPRSPASSSQSSLQRCDAAALRAAVCHGSPAAAAATTTTTPPPLPPPVPPAEQRKNGGAASAHRGARQGARGGKAAAHSRAKQPPPLEAEDDAALLPSPSQRSPSAVDVVDGLLPDVTAAQRAGLGSPPVSPRLPASPMRPRRPTCRATASSGRRSTHRGTASSQQQQSQQQRRRRRPRPLPAPPPPPPLFPATRRASDLPRYLRPHPQSVYLPLVDSSVEPARPLQLCLEMQKDDGVGDVGGDDGGDGRRSPLATAVFEIRGGGGKLCLGPRWTEGGARQAEETHRVHAKQRRRAAMRKTYLDGGDGRSDAARRTAPRGAADAQLQQSTRPPAAAAAAAAAAASLLASLDAAAADPSACQLTILESDDTGIPRRRRRRRQQQSAGGEGGTAAVRMRTTLAAAAAAGAAVCVAAACEALRVGAAAATVQRAARVWFAHKAVAAARERREADARAMHLINRVGLLRGWQEKVERRRRRATLVLKRLQEMLQEKRATVAQEVLAKAGRGLIGRRTLSDRHSQVVRIQRIQLRRAQQAKRQAAVLVLERYFVHGLAVVRVARVRARIGRLRELEGHLDRSALCIQQHARQRVAQLRRRRVEWRRYEPYPSGDS